MSGQFADAWTRRPRSWKNHGRRGTPAQFGAFVTALRIKGETAEEIAGLASVMRAQGHAGSTPTAW